MAGLSPIKSPERSFFTGAEVPLTALVGALLLSLLAVGIGHIIGPGIRRTLSERNHSNTSGSPRQRTPSRPR